MMADHKKELYGELSSKDRWSQVWQCLGGNGCPLKILKLHHNSEEQTVMTMQKLASNDSLEVLELGQLGVQGAQALAHALVQHPVLHSLVVRDCGNMGSMGPLASGMAAARSLKELSLSGLDAASVCLLGEALQRHGGLEKLSLDHVHMNQDSGNLLGAAVTRCPRLCSLSITETSWEDEACVSTFAQQLKGHTTLRNVDLKGSRFASGGAHALGLFLAHTPTPKEICLQHCNLGDEGCHQLATGLTGAQQAHVLDLQHNSIGAHGAQALGQLLSSSPGIKVLWLAENTLGDAGLAALCVGLSTNLSLNTLTLDKNGIRDIHPLVTVLSKGQCRLGELSLAHNALGDEAVVSLAGSLPHSGLVRLDLQGTRTGDAGASALAEALPHCALQHLFLASNKIRQAGAELLMTQAFACKQLLTLTLADNGVPRKMIQEVRDTEKCLAARRKRVAEEGAAAPIISDAGTAKVPPRRSKSMVEVQGSWVGSPVWSGLAHSWSDPHSSTDVSAVWKKKRDQRDQEQSNFTFYKVPTITPKLSLFGVRGVHQEDQTEAITVRSFDRSISLDVWNDSMTPKPARNMTKLPSLAGWVEGPGQEGSSCPLKTVDSGESLALSDTRRLSSVSEEMVSVSCDDRTSSDTTVYEVSDNDFVFGGDVCGMDLDAMQQLMFPVVDGDIMQGW